MRDLLIAGGGPIGLATALYAARAGLDVVIREPRTGPIDKACGEGLMPGAVAALRDLGVRPEGRQLCGIRYLDARHTAEAAFRADFGLGVRRTVLQQALARRVEAAGVTTEARRVHEVLNAADHVEVDGAPVRYVIAADGLHSRVRRALRLDRPPASSPRFGQRCHVEMEPWTSYVEVHWSAVGEAYVTPVGPRQVGVAVLSRDRRPLAELLRGFPLLAARIDDQVRSRPRGAGPLRQRSKQRVAGRVLLVGDAAGYIDAITGEGIAIGMAQARAAVEAVVAGTPSRYEAAWRRIGWRHTALTSGLVMTTRLSVVRRHIVHSASVAPSVFAAAVDQLARPA
ncbi:NAD(P)/FAD-dependent oxidoreductase [Flexivirga alba]|uniref:NAD(P)/FAD-dependent oxidoreductase n=1 Tax=Flexivirga alba TaxID=702742 RepID=A0ABW2AKA4_9MICO